MHSACYNIKAERQFYPEARQTGIYPCGIYVIKDVGGEIRPGTRRPCGHEPPVREKSVVVTASYGV